MRFNFKYSLLGCLLISIASLHGQPHPIGHSTITLTDASRSNRSIPTEVYYPGTVAGDNVPLANGKFQTIAFGHGFVMTFDAYANIWKALVPNGFIVALPKTEGGASPSHGEFGKDLAFVLQWFQSAGKDNQSPFYNKIDTLNCVMGHSMGGGAAFLAAQQKTVVKRIATLAAAETNPSAIQCAAGMNMPALVIAAGNDCVTPPPNHQIPMYDALKSSCKSYVSINGGSHCQMAEDNFLCNFGEATCNPKPTITRAVQHSVVTRFLLPWLQFQLKGGCTAGALFDSLLNADKSITARANCELCKKATGASQFEAIAVQIYPNPFRDVIHLKGLKSTVVSAELFDASGRAVLQFLIRPAAEPLQLKKDLPGGLYLLRVNDGGNMFVQKMLKTD
jgi:pimeloyl-ACP methyl ester carboxylesterase